uniref:Fibroblast growth factor 9 n=1 Tax=Oryzias latipes TaxID=8090 RepID=A0A3P9LWE9_ORYLA
MSVFCDAGRSLGEPEVIQEQLLYCRVGIGFHLQILPGGWLKLFSIRPGLVAIRGVRSGLFLCMSRDGWAHGAVSEFSDDCIFKENLEENHYTTYSSYSHPGNYLALSRKGELRRGGSANRNQASTHFLPRRRLWWNISMMKVLQTPSGLSGNGTVSLLRSDSMRGGSSSRVLGGPIFPDGHVVTENKTFT